MIGIQGSTPLLWGSLLFWLATGPIVACLKRGEELAPVVRSSTFTTLRFAPIAFVSAFVFGVADNGGGALPSGYSLLGRSAFFHFLGVAGIAYISALALHDHLGVLASS